MASTVTPSSSSSSSSLTSLVPHGSPGTPPIDLFRSLSELAALAAETDKKEEGDQFKPWVPRVITSANAAMAMWRGLQEAIEDGQKADLENRRIYATVEQVIPADILASLLPRTVTPGAGTKRKAVEVGAGTASKVSRAVAGAEAEAKIRDQAIRWGVASSVGKRKQMEDANLVIHTSDDEVVAAVLDGHGGVSIAKFVQKAIKTRYFSILEEVDGNILMAFERCVYSIHQDVLKTPDFKFMGTTLVLTHIDMKIKRIHVAAVGDSSAIIHRKIEGEFRVISLCARRNWAHPIEAARAAKILKDPSIAETWPRSPDPKLLRVNGNAEISINGVPGHRTLNISRGIGDSDYGHLVSQEPVFSTCSLLSEDIIEIVSDGVTDFLGMAARSNVMATMHHNSPDVLAKTIHDLALAGMKNKKIGDNITVIVIKV